MEYILYGIGIFVGTILGRLFCDWLKERKEK